MEPQFNPAGQPENWQTKVKRFIKETIRVIRVTKKPGKTEYLSIVKVTGIGILLIGLLGFLIFLIKQLLF